ncbi:hypothetical protein [Paracoccus mutanolyticus]|nr:hypothetical protein [Paracoccus mutanolyticus]
MLAAAGQIMAEAQKGGIVTGLRIEGLPSAAQVFVTIDREKAMPSA